MPSEVAGRLQISWLAGFIASASLKAAIVAIPLTLLLMVVNFASTFVDREPIRAHIAEAFAEGQLIRDPFGERRDIGYNQWNDCLILSMIVRDDVGTNLSRAMGPFWREGANPCADLQDYMTAKTSGAPLPPAGESYSRYLHGDAAIVPIFINVFSLDMLRTLFSFFTLANMIALIAVSCWYVGKSARAADAGGVSRGSFVAVAAVCLLMFFEYNRYSMGLSHFPNDSLLVGYLWLALFTDFGRAPIRSVVVVHAVFGVLTAWTEFLTGGLPLGFCLIAYMFAANAGGANALAVGKSSLAGLFAFLAAFVAAFAVKVGLSAVVNEGSINLFFSTLTRRMAGQVTDQPVDSQFNFIAMLERFWWGAGRVGGEWNMLGRLMLFSAFASVAWSVVIVVRRRMKATERLQPILLFVAFGTICVWHIAFHPHTANHDFMIRTLVGLYFPAVMLVLCLHRVRLGALARSAAAMLAPNRT
jgi:hypothetical protein